MNKKIYFWLLCCLLGGLLLSCNQKELTKYEDDPSLYFHKQTIIYKDNYQDDNILYSFYVKDDAVVRDTVWVIINTMGFPQNFDRPIRVIQDSLDKKSAAKSGVHYVALDDKDIVKHMVIPAGKVSTKIPIILLRDKLDKKTVYHIYLKIVPNEHFNAGIGTQLGFLVKLTDMGVKPPLWDSDWFRTFGPWGPVKMKFLYQYLGLKEFGYTGDVTSEMMSYFGTKASELLREYNEKNNTILKEEDGTVVKFN